MIRTRVPTGQSSWGSATVSLNSPMRLSEERRPVFRLTRAPWMMVAGEERYIARVPSGFSGPGEICFRSGSRSVCEAAGVRRGPSCAIGPAVSWVKETRTFPESGGGEPVPCARMAEAAPAATICAEVVSRNRVQPRCGVGKPLLRTRRRMAPLATIVEVCAKGRPPRFRAGGHRQRKG